MCVILSLKLIVQRYSFVKFTPQIGEDKKNRTYLGEQFLNSLTKILFIYLIVMFKFLYTAVNQFESSKLKENAKDKKTQLIYMYACLHESLNLTSNIYTDCLHINNFSSEII